MLDQRSKMNQVNLLVRSIVTMVVQFIVQNAVAIVVRGIPAWIVPGLGHYLAGQKRRAVILGTTIGSLWLMGLLIGGVSVIDRRDRGDGGSFSLMFLGQVFVAPSVVVDQLRESMLQAHAKATTTYGDPMGSLLPDNHPPFSPAIGKVAEVATLYVAIAGFLNLLAIIDAVVHDPDSRTLDNCREIAASDLRPATGIGNGASSSHAQRTQSSITPGAANPNGAAL